MIDCRDGKDHEWVQVITFKEVYRTCIRCTEKQNKVGENWEVRVSSDIL